MLQAVVPSIRSRAFRQMLPAIFGTLLSASPVCAQSTGIAAERMFFQSGPSAFFQVEGAQVAEPRQIWLHSAALAIAHPLRLRNQYTGELLSTPVDYRVTLDLGAELGIWKKRLALGIGLPVAVWQNGDRLVSTGGTDLSVEKPLRVSAVGDLRLRARMRLTPTDWFWGILTTLDFTIPGGGQTDFVATAGPTVSPKLVGWFQKGPIAAAVNLSARLAPVRALYQTTLRHSIEWGAAASAAFPTRRIGLALLTEAVGYYYPGTSIHSTELRGGLRFGLRQAAVDVGGGGGLGPFAPDWRAFVSVRGAFSQRPSPSPSCAERPLAL